MAINEERLHDGWDEYAGKSIYRHRGKIGIWRSLGYGVFSQYSMAMQGMVGGWLLFFYTNFCGLSAVQGASIFAIGRVVDAFTTLLAGSISDKFYKLKIGRRFGRRHFFILLAAPASLIAILMWVPGMHYVYYLFSYLITNMLLSAFEIPYDALANEMSDDYSERTKLSTMRMVMAGAGAPLISWTLAQVFTLWPQTSPTPYIVGQTIFSILSFILVLVTFFSTWEHFVTRKEAAIEESRRPQHKKANVGRAFWQAVKNYFSTLKIKSFRKHLLIFGASYLAASVWGTVFTYYIVDVIGQTPATAAYLGMFSLVSIPVTIIAGWAITKIAPRSLYAIAYIPILITCGAAVLFALYQPSHILIWLSIMCFVYQTGQYILWFIPWNVFPNIPDLDTLVTGENRSGVFASVMMFIYQTSFALGSVVVGLLLDASGFIKSTGGTVNEPASAKMMIVGIISIGVGGLILIALISAATFKLDKNTFKIISDELKRLKAGGKMSAVDPETKRVCNMLTGIDYDSIDVWKRAGMEEYGGRTKGKDD